MGYVGTYDRTIFYNPGNKYCIISVKTSDQSVPQQARSAYRHRDNMIRFIAVGYELPQTDKVSMILDGEWENGKHGVQLQVDKCEEIVPQTKEGVYGYLSSRLIKGVGEKTAALIVNRFGADALRVLENEPERLLEIRGITPDKLEDIKASYAESRCVRDLMILLTPFNVTPVTAMKIYEHFGSRSVDILQKNPYELCQVSGFGFKRVDAIVRKGDLPLNSPMRIHGAVFAALDTGRNEKGHLFLEEDALAKTGVKLLNENITDGQVKITPEEVDAVVQDSHFVIGGPSFCVCCGQAYHSGHLKCRCEDTVVCMDCGNTVPKQNARYMEGAYHCHACLHICGSCGEMIHGTMYPAYDRRGRLVEICESCYRASLEPCAACSVCSICRIIGNAFCHRTSITVAEGGAR